MTLKSFGTSFYTLIVERRLARYYPWLLTGLAVLYVLTFPVTRVALWVTVPVAVAGWFYYRRGGFWAGILAFPVNLFLIDAFQFKITWQSLTQLTNGILFGHVFVIVMGMSIGHLRREVENLYHHIQRLGSQERILILVNMAVRDILERKDINEGYYRLVTHIANLFVADYGYLVYWNASACQAVVLCSTRRAPQEYPALVLKPAESTLIMSALESNRVLFIEHAETDPLLTESPLFREHLPALRSAMAAPLIAKNYIFGAIVLGFDSRRRRNVEELAYFELAGVQITLALKSILQEQKIENQLKEANALASIARALSESEKIGQDAVLQLIVNSARELIPDTTHAVLHLLDQDQQVLVPRAVAGNYKGQRSNLNMHLGEGVAGQVLYDGEAVTVSDVRTDMRFINQTMSAGFRSMAVTPVLLNQKRIGTISVLSSEVGRFQLDEINLLNSLGTLSAIAIENSLLLEDIQKALQETNALYEISRELVTLNFDDLLDRTVNLLQKNFRYYHVQIFLFEPETGDLTLRAASGTIGQALMQRGYRLEPGKGIVGHVYATATPLLAENVAHNPFFDWNPLLPETRSELAVLIKSEHHIFGVLDVQQASSRVLSPRDLQLINAIADHLSAALQKADLYGNLQIALQQEKTMRSQLMQSERLAMVGRLLASISHELNNPLQAIQNVLFLMKNEEQLSSQGREDLEVILSETERMTSLIGRLRTTYRTPTAGEFVEVWMNTVIEDVYALTATYMRHKNIVFEFLQDGTEAVIPGIPDQMRQVLLNLFMNAIDAMPNGGKITVSTQSLPEQEKIYLTVLDSGPGIASAILPNIFEPFTTDKHTGTGLGMTIVRDIILQHSGEIQAENYAKGGALFKIWLPSVKKE